MPFIPPPEISKAELDRIGMRIRLGHTSLADRNALEQWRASHLYVINTFQSALRGRRRRDTRTEVTIAQRLKRRPTIIDKLSREPKMMLSRMHDIAGCRMIFDNISELDYFRSGVLAGRAMHNIMGDEGKYNYIDSPKFTGYRGIHDVYNYNVRSSAGEKWNGLRIELQYRTQVQHAWATAVEISDIVNATRLKFNDAGTQISRLFVLSSEVLSRAHENRPGFCCDLKDTELVQEIEAIEASIHAISRLKNLTSSEFRKFARASKLFILINYTSGFNEGKFEAHSYLDNNSAVKAYAEFESKLQDEADVVLVGASQQDSIKLAYTNYFSDASAFISYLEAGIRRLKPNP